jgi:hypothetical protein
MDPDSILTKGLGFGLEMLGDPLSYTPWALGKAAGMLGRGAAAAGKVGRGAAALEEAAPSLVSRFPGATPEFAPITSRPNVYLSASEAAQAGGADQLAGSAVRRLSPPTVTQPSTYADELLAKYAPEASKIGRYTNAEILDANQTAQLQQLMASGGRMPSGMHGQIFNSKAVGPLGFTADVANRPQSGVTIARAMRNALSPEELVSRQTPGLHGFYDRATNTIVEMAGAPPATTPHELLHALTWNAAQSGNWENLPFLQRIAARLYRPYATDVARVGTGFAPKGFRSGLGTLADELGSFTMENPTLGSRIAGGAKFLFKSPGEALGLMPEMSAARASYARDFARHSPLVGELYRGLGWSPYVTAGAGLAGLGGYALSGE